MFCDLNWFLFRPKKIYLIWIDLIWWQIGACWKSWKMSFLILQWMWVLLDFLFHFFPSNNFLNFLLACLSLLILFLEIQVVIELLLGLVLCMWAALTVPGKFLSIHPDSEENRYADLVSLSSYMSNTIAPIMPFLLPHKLRILQLICKTGFLMLQQMCVNMICLTYTYGQWWDFGKKKTKITSKLCFTVLIMP